jgi:hypothetical protein
MDCQLVNTIQTCFRDEGAKPMNDCQARFFGALSQVAI